MLTAGTTVPLTTIVSELLVAVSGDAHAAVDVMIHETTSALARDAFVYVALLVPTFPPFNFH